MQLPNCKIWQAAATDKTRPVLNSVYYNADKKQLEAADGFILAVVPVPNANGEPGGIIPLNVFKEAAKLGRRKDDTPAVKLEEGTATAGKVDKYEREEYEGEPTPLTEGRYPDLAQVAASEDEYEQMFAVNAEYLHRLADAICEQGSPWVILYRAKSDSKYSKREDRPIRVKAIAPAEIGAYGVIMPMHVDDRKR